MKSIQECWDKAGKGPIGTRWIDIKKGDLANPEYRSRAVAKDLSNNNKKTMGLFAATPPLEALKLLISSRMTEGIGWERRSNQPKKMELVDVRGAYFHAES